MLTPASVRFYVARVPAVLAALTGAAHAGDNILEVPAEYATIQAALDASTDGDEVVLAAGTYAIIEPLVFPAHAVTLRSASGVPTATVIDGSAIDSKSASSMLRILDDAPGVRRITGLTFRNGPGGVSIGPQVVTALVRIDGNVFESIGPYPALRAIGLDVEIEDNVFTDNQAYLWGGAIYLGGNARITSNTFTGNEAIPFKGSVLTQGGAIYLAGSGDHKGALTAEIDDNTFEGNTCTDYGGAINCGGWEGDIFIRNNAFLENDAGVCAGAIYQFALPAATMTIEGNLFVRNISQQGGAIALENTSGHVIRANTFIDHFGNETLKLLNTSGITVEQNLFAFNFARAFTIMLSPDVVLTCNDSFGNPAGDYPPGYPAPGDGNLSLDPKFCNPESGDYTLAEDSPCLPENNGCGLLMGAFDVGCGASPTETLSWGAIKDRYVER